METFCFTGCQSGRLHRFGMHSGHGDLLATDLGCINGLAMTNHGHMIFTGCTNRVRVFEIMTGRESRRPYILPEGVGNIALNVDETALFAVCCESICELGLHTGEIRRTIKEGSCYRLAMDDFGEMLFIGTIDERLHQLDLDSGDMIWTLSFNFDMPFYGLAVARVFTRGDIS